jgi:hypothetical protein
MTDGVRRYLEIVSEMVRLRGDSGMTRARELEYVGRLDRIWTTLDEAEQMLIEQELGGTDATPTEDD